MPGASRSSLTAEEARREREHEQLGAALDRLFPDWAAEAAAEPDLHEQSAAEVHRDDEAARAHVRRHGYRETFTNIRRRPLKPRRIRRAGMPARRSPACSG
ncbi:MAG: hypothetical protein JWN32_491, partial [Solirubrobacterales bacterium]|nr:hypothetical protein [Solirubrobacterales bacterium]